jgi:hypothetical protein
VLTLLALMILERFESSESSFNFVNLISGLLSLQLSDVVLASSCN